MPTVEITTHMSVTLGSVVKEYGSTTDPVNYTITNGHVFETRGQVDDDYSDDVLWNSGEGGLDKFELLYFISDADVFLELRTDMAADEYLIIEVKANVPLILTSDDMAGHDTAARFDGLVLVEDTDWAQCDQIAVQRNVGAAGGDAVWHLVLMS
jgi:hypothetical protein